ncbi:MAG: UDP-N-acetylglucosamine 1-carboxyvinyltransferase, partial [Acidaminococcales bacterium]|nr:UDP-N-acetylglucosamine 1-carboxyvinyltransferase [Acidaminococcales bacterium]
MDKLIIRGGKKLSGTIKVSSAKNAVLPIIAASILATTPSRIEDIPVLEDVRTISEVLTCLGLSVKMENKALNIDGKNISNNEAPYELMRKMRASFLVMGPLLARKGKARVSLPGGCA